MILPKTYRALAQLRTDYIRNPGVHKVPEEHATMRGTVVRRADLDLSAHEIVQVDPFRKSLIGTPQVKIRHPKNSLPINILVHGGEQPALSSDWDFLKEAKLMMLADVAIALSEAVGARDRGSIVLMGQAQALDIPRSEVLPGSEDPGAAASTVETFSQGRGFNLLVSDDFQTLLLSGLTKIRRKSTVGVKVLHPLERELPANVGVVSFGGRREVNTNRPNDLMTVNTLLQAQHQGVLDELSGIGIPTAAVTFDGHQSQNFNTNLADSDVASTVRTMLMIKR